MSGLLNPEGKPAQILNLILNQKLIFLYDNRILQEYIGVLHRKKINFPHYLIEPIIDFVKMDGEYVTAEPVKEILPDEADTKFLEVAATGNAKYLITGNTAHYPKITLIKTPAEFIKLLYQ